VGGDRWRLGSRLYLLVSRVLGAEHVRSVGAKSKSSNTCAIKFTQPSDCVDDNRERRRRDEEGEEDHRRRRPPCAIASGRWASPSSSPSSPSGRRRLRFLVALPLLNFFFFFANCSPYLPHPPSPLVVRASPLLGAPHHHVQIRLNFRSDWSKIWRGEE
jgi:hypothetical protein